MSTPDDYRQPPLGTLRRWSALATEMIAEIEAHLDERTMPKETETATDAHLEWRVSWRLSSWQPATWGHRYFQRRWHANAFAHTLRRSGSYEVVTIDVRSVGEWRDPEASA